MTDRYERTHHRTDPFRVCMTWSPTEFPDLPGAEGPRAVAAGVQLHASEPWSRLVMAATFTLTPGEVPGAIVTTSGSPMDQPGLVQALYLRGEDAAYLRDHLVWPQVAADAGGYYWKSCKLAPLPTWEEGHPYAWAGALGQAEYVERVGELGRNVCPRCGGTMIESDTLEPVSPSWWRQQRWCQYCGAAWQDEFDLGGWTHHDATRR